MKRKDLKESISETQHVIMFQLIEIIKKLKHYDMYEYYKDARLKKLKERKIMEFIIGSIIITVGLSMWRMYYSIQREREVVQHMRDIDCMQVEAITTHSGIVTGNCMYGTSDKVRHNCDGNIIYGIPNKVRHNCDDSIIYGTPDKSKCNCDGNITIWR